MSSCFVFLHEVFVDLDMPIVDFLSHPFEDSLFFGLFLKYVLSACC